MRRISLAAVRTTVGLRPRYDYKALAQSIQTSNQQFRRAFIAYPPSCGGLQYIQDILMAEDANFLHLVQEAIEEPIRGGARGSLHKLQVQKLRILTKIKHQNLSLEEQVRMVAANRLITHSSLLELWESCALTNGSNQNLPLPTVMLLGQQMVADGEYDLVADFLTHQFSFGDILMLGGRVIASGEQKNKLAQRVMAFELCRAFEKHGFAQQLAREFWIGDINGGLHFCRALDSCTTEPMLQAFLHKTDRVKYRLSKYNSGAFLLDGQLHPYERMRLLEKYAELGRIDVLHNFFFNKAVGKQPEWLPVCIERVIRLAMADNQLPDLVKAVLEKKKDLPVWCTSRITALVSDQKSLRSLWGRYHSQYCDRKDPIVRQTMVGFLEKSIVLGDIHTTSDIIKELGQEHTPLPLVRQYLRILFNHRMHAASNSHNYDMITRVFNVYSSNPSEIIKAVGSIWAEVESRGHNRVSKELLWDVINAFEASKLPFWSKHMEKQLALAVFDRPPVEKVKYFFLPKVSVRAIWLCIQTELTKAMETDKGDMDRNGRLQLITIALMAIRIKSKTRRFQRSFFISGPKEKEETEKNIAVPAANPFADQLNLDHVPPRDQLELLQVPSEYLKIRDLDMFLLQHIGKQEIRFSQLQDMDQWIYDILNLETYQPNLQTLSVEDPGLAYRLLRWFRHDFIFPVPAHILRAMVPGFASSEMLTNSMSFRYISEVVSQLRLQHESVGTEVCEQLVESLFDRVSLPGASRDKRRLQWALMLAKQEHVDEKVVEKWNKRLEDMKKRQVGFWAE